MLASEKAYIVLYLCFWALARPACAAELLVLLSSKGLKSSHSTFLSDLRASGFSTDIQLLSSNSLRLQSWGRWLYDGVVVLAQGEAELGGALDSSYLVELVDSGRGLFVAADEGASPSIRETMTDLGTDMLSKGTQVQDYISHDSSQGPAALLTSGVHMPAITGDVGAPILFRGTGATLSPNATLTAPVLAPAATAVAGSGSSALAGPNLVLATAMQSRTNARTFFVASVDALSDAAFSTQPSNAAGGAEGGASKTGNRALAAEAAKWAFKRKGMLRLSNFEHRRSGDAAPPPLATYTINDQIHVSLDLHENDGDDWQPHVTENLQAQFVMLDPYIRKRMQHTGNGHYELNVRAPDKYGIFKWVIEYSAPGYSKVALEEVTPLRPLQHDQFPRFVLQAYPYYAALMSVSVGFFVVVLFVLYHK